MEENDAAEATLTLEDLAGTDEIVIGNSVRRSIPVASVTAADGSIIFE
jgi:branched-subunit amino acid aminotransferase/4-amino-4-deoxychorismate lyase